MRVFAMMEVNDAVAHSQAGGQALHLHTIIPDRDRAPKCFVDAVDRGEYIAHLFDTDRSRLVETARRLGVRVLHVDRDGDRGQHIDLCSGPLRKAYKLLERADQLKLAKLLAALRERKSGTDD